MNLINLQFQAVSSEINNIRQVLSNIIGISFLNDNFDSKIITITEFYDYSFNTTFSSDFVSQFIPVSDSSDYLKYFPGFSSMRSGGTNSDIVFRGMFGSRLHILDGNSEIFGACSSRMDTS